ncbi:MAG: ATP-binding protein [Syntrophorhabdaceae bacterium]|nr:ATP-binding protein [Syntrophorhabdaceae bacterium]MDD5243452.1 ATP-binding protein [Syntrophorhabdaceae bacterium]
MTNDIRNQQQFKSLSAFNVNYKIRLKESNLNEIVQRAELFLPQYVNGNIRLKMSLVEKELYVMADIIRMEEAVINLVKNASDAMTDGGVLTFSTGRVNFQDESIYTGNNWIPSACAVFSIEDTGTGMDKRTSERAFEPFFTTKPGMGKGLGLPIAYSIIKQHNGSIKVDSSPGRGTKVNVYLPLVKTVIRQMQPIPLSPSLIAGRLNGDARY